VIVKRRRAFTIVELLLVIGIIILLLSILIVAVNAATRSAQRANTSALLSSLSQGLVQFEQEVGYLPPVLDATRRVVAPPDPDGGTFAVDIQDWYSVTSLAEFLVGYGSQRQDGYGFDAVSNLYQDENPPAGIRDPGRDGAWGATLNDDNGNGLFGDLGDRNPPIEGRVYGPYVDVSDERLLGSIDSTTGAVFFPGEAGYDPVAPKVICDYWGRPIRYYRRVHVPGTIDYPDRRVSLSEVVLLRPFQAKEANVVPDAVTYGGAPIGLTTYELQSKDFGLFSGGPDTVFDPTARADDDELNRDNVVEVGP
jgi:type II secretory pathway pseudopilin PulG